MRSRLRNKPTPREPCAARMYAVVQGVRMSRTQPHAQDAQPPNKIFARPSPAYAQREEKKNARKCVQHTKGRRGEALPNSSLHPVLQPPLLYSNSTPMMSPWVRDATWGHSPHHAPIPLSGCGRKKNVSGVVWDVGLTTTCANSPSTLPLTLSARRRGTMARARLCWRKGEANDFTPSRSHRNASVFRRTQINAPSSLVLSPVSPCKGPRV